jgi:hypothetical protein
MAGYRNRCGHSPCRNSNPRSSNSWPILYTDVIPAVFHAGIIPCRYFHIKWLHPTLRLSQILRIENCMMVIQCTTRTGLFIYSPTSISAYVYPTDTLSTKCSQFHDTSANRPCASYWNYESFSFLWDLTEEMQFSALHIRKGNGKRGNSYQISDFTCTWQLLYCREQNQGGHTFLYPFPTFLSTDFLIPWATSAKIVSIYSVVKKRNQAPDIKARWGSLGTAQLHTYLTAELDG